MFKVLPYNKPKELEKLLNDGWVMRGIFTHNNKTVLVLAK